MTITKLLDSVAIQDFQLLWSDNMNTLELMVAEVLKDNGFIPHEKAIKAGAEYIEMVNSMKEENEPIYTPEKWLKDTKKFSDEKLLIKKIDGYYEICDYIVRQRELCIDQTGCSFCITDLKEHFDAPDFKERFGIYDISLNDILNFLLVYYQKEGCTDENDFI